MGLETTTYIDGLVTTNPLDGDQKAAGAGHLRLLKSTIKATFPNVTGAVTPTHTELNYVDGVTSAIQTQLDAEVAARAAADALKAPLASPTFTGTVALPSTTSIGNASATEIGYLDGVTSAIQGQIDAKAALASPALTGTPTAPTATAGTSTTQIATTAFVGAAAFSAVLPSQVGNSGKFVTTDGTAASWAEAVTPTAAQVLTNKTIAYASNTLTGVQPTLVSGTSIKTINGTTLLGAGDLTVSSGLVLLAVASAASSATIDFTGIDGTYDEYLIEFQNVVPANTGTQLFFRMSTDGGSSFVATGYSYAVLNNSSTAGTPAGGVGNATTQVRLDVGGLSNASANGGISGSLRLIAPAGTSHHKAILFHNVCYDGTSYFNVVGTGVQAATSAVNAIRFYINSGNVASGLFKLYGLRKSV